MRFSSRSSATGSGRDRKQRERDLQHWVQKYADGLTYQARTHPYNWFNFYGFWENHS